MSNTRVAHRYSKALMDLAIETNQVDAVKADIDGIRKATTGELERALVSPVIRHDKKCQIFKALFGGKVLPITEKFFDLVFTKGRELSMVEILDAFNDRYRELKGIRIVELTTAVPISDELRNDFRNRLLKMERYQGKTVQIQEKVDANILGGFVLQMEDDLFDASIQRDLKDIKTQFIENMYIQKIR
ncbi:ATP synthase F1 subunit delta [Flavihumibacter petaseus]|uniref:ATP synthase subunit delta n=1 Tax=Flavihumibacter petaseus NBRC 106054 TaxID=1220578 RepID=A0A0E9N6V5_9BACT|nr:ATP synthase F1 subunit delta [Flavihumibacter petaseus]GAO45080.1 ATP synthase subunit delta [Flavihumibacter petaseus NBRC 106054]